MWPLPNPISSKYNSLPKQIYSFFKDSLSSSFKKKNEKNLRNLIPQKGPYLEQFWQTKIFDKKYRQYFWLPIHLYFHKKGQNIVIRKMTKRWNSQLWNNFVSFCNQFLRQIKRFNEIHCTLLLSNQCSNFIKKTRKVYNKNFEINNWPSRHTTSFQRL